MAAGAVNLTGGWFRYGNVISPVVLADVPARREGVRRGGLRPGARGHPGRLRRRRRSPLVNDSAFGLQAGVFTHSLQTAFTAHRVLEVGGIIVGDVPSYRADQMPYGGVKGSGVGREGLRSAMDDYTDARVMVLTGIDL